VKVWNAKTGEEILSLSDHVQRVYSLALSPDGDRIVDVKYFVALTYYDHNHFDDAITRFMDIINNHATHRLANYSAIFQDGFARRLGQEHDGGNRLGTDVAGALERFSHVPDTGEFHHCTPAAPGLRILPHHRG
jgi:WD40 repeat protein